MTKKLKILSLTVFSVLAVSSVAVAGKKSLTSNADGDTWYHYNAVAPTTKGPGIKEYWTNCNGLTVIEEPEGESIVERGTPTEAFINKLSNSDDRRVAKLGKIDFEDPSDLAKFNISSAKSSAIVEDETATSGSHVLKIVAAGSTEGQAIVHVQMLESVLDELFADENVKGLYFDIKSTGRYNNFRRETSNKGATPYDFDTTGTGVDGLDYRTGLDTVWKTYCFERSFYTEAKAFIAAGKTPKFIKAEGLAVDTEIYVDNIRVSSHGNENSAYYGFELGSIRKVSGSDWRGYGYYRNNIDSRYPTSEVAQNADWKLQDDGVADSVSFSYDIKSEGNRSLMIKKTSAANALCLYLPKELGEATSKGLLIDVYFDEKVDGVDVNACNGVINGTVQVSNNLGNVLGNKNHDSGKWKTYLIPKSNFSYNGDGYFRALRWTGSQCNGTFYVDNIRPAEGVFGFEDVSFGISQDNVEVGLGNIPASQRIGGQNIRDNFEHLFYINGGTQSGELSEDFASEGLKSFKYVQRSGSTVFNVYFNKAGLESLIGDDGVSIDIMTTNGHINKFGENQEVVADGLWHTYTISKATMLSLRASTHMCLAYNANASAGTYYFDNFRIL